MIVVAKRLLALVLFWLMVFLIGRIAFFCCIVPFLNDVPISLVFQSLYKGLRLDLSAVAYLVLLPFVFLVLHYFTQKKIFNRLFNILNIGFLVIYILTAVGEACLYREWKSKLSVQALLHFMHPAEVFKTSSTGLTVLFFGLSFLLSWFFIKIYFRYISSFQVNEISVGSFGVKLFKFFISFIVGLIVIFLGIRGGWQQIPIQSSDAFFSIQPITNDAATNPFWNLAYNLIDYENRFKTNPFNDFSNKEAKERVAALYQVEKDSTEIFLNNPKPNIVFIILESWTAHEIKSFGGDDFAPFMDSLSKEGIRFSQFYPAGYVSDQGIPAVLSSYPTVSRISVINQSSKSATLPCINQDLKPLGYQSGFLFGGDLNYGNIKSYVFNKKFDIIREEKDFPSKYRRGKLGIQDGDMQEEYLQYLNQAKQPFVYAWFTLSSHMPYDFPGEKKPLVNHKENDYVNSIAYADNALRQFFNAAKKQDWYKNTLFVLVADHSHGDQKDYSVYDSEFHRIPMVFFGDVIKESYRGKNVSKVFSQLDIVKTLLNQMNEKHAAKQYVWGKDMFNPYSRQVAYYCSFAGGGVVTDKGKLGFQHGLKTPVINSFDKDAIMTDSLMKIGKAFQQEVFEDYRLR